VLSLIHGCYPVKLTRKYGDAESVRGRRLDPPIWKILNKALSLSEEEEEGEEEEGEKEEEEHQSSPRIDDTPRKRSRR
jgi:hypothetical protein